MTPPPALAAPSTPIVAIHDVTYAYPSADEPVLHAISLALDAASFTLVVGESGAGKSTLLRLVNGLVPHFSGGRFGGAVHVEGRDTRAYGPRDLASTVGFVFQDPEAQMLTDRVDDEIAFGMEQVGVPRATMRKRVEEALDLMGIGHLRERSPAALSGGERQRVAIASAMAMHPGVLVLDEPTSQLDPWAAEDVLLAVKRLNDDLGTTILMAEHRLERTMHHADRIVEMRRGGIIAEGTSEAMVRMLPLGALPPVTQLGMRLGWNPVPLTMKAARRALGATYPARIEQGRPAFERGSGASGIGATYPFGSSSGDPVIRIERATVRRGNRDVLREVSLTVHAGEIVALMGRNGSGKTSLLRAIAGLDQPRTGRITIEARGPATASRGRAGMIGYVPQQAGALLWHESVRADVAVARSHRHDAPPVEAVLDQAGIAHLADRHPRDLSAGERMRAAMAVVLAGEPSVLLLDEPTRGMDWRAKDDLMRAIARICADGVPALIATHDIELMARFAQTVVLLGDREVVAVGPPRDVLAGSLTFSTQMNTLLGGAVLTVDDALEVLIGDG